MESPVSQLYRALEVPDLIAVAAVLSEDTILHIPGHSPGSGDHLGRDAVLQHVQQSLNTTGASLVMQLHRTLADTEWAVALATYTATRPDGRTLDNNVAHVCRLSSGLIAEGWLYSRNLYDVDEFWAMPGPG